MAHLNPYLHFNGQAEAAFRFYQSVFGGELQLMRYNEAPPMEGQPRMSAEAGEKIMHVALPIGKHSLLMASDLPDHFPPGTQGNMSYISIDAESKDEALRLFNALKAGGQEHMPIGDTFWGSYFGMVADQFGVQWMVSYAYPK